MFAQLHPEKPQAFMGSWYRGGIGRGRKTPQRRGAAPLPSTILGPLLLEIQSPREPSILLVYVVYIGMHFHTCVGTHVPSLQAWVCTYVWRPEVKIGGFLHPSCLHLHLLKSGLLLEPELPIQLG